MDYNTLITGFPRIGEKRELKKALESYWKGKITSKELHIKALEIRQKNWLIQKEKGIDLISCNDFSFYDNMLDTAIMLNAIPDRFSRIEDKTEKYFAMARGNDNAKAMEMTKWFNTNYHYIVPEINSTTNFKLNASKIVSEYIEAKELGITPKINIVGPLTFLYLSKIKDNINPIVYYKPLLIVYSELIKQISQLDQNIILQIDEPLFVKDPSEKQLELLRKTYSYLPQISNKVKIIVTTYFEHSIEAIKVLSETPIWGLGLDFVHGKENIEALKYLNGKRLIAGVVDGRNIWINNFNKSLQLLEKITEKVDSNKIIISTSCSLLHVPYSLKNEPESKIDKWLSFAYEKIDELILINKLFRQKKLSIEEKVVIEKNHLAIETRKTSPIIKNINTCNRILGIKNKKRDCKFKERIQIQKKILNLPILPTTTIGSFPQTDKLRKVRRDYKNSKITLDEYESSIKTYIDHCIAVQEEIGLDVLVHGEPERNDMVEYFGEMLDGFHFTKNGWVQSYGSRCVKPPVIFGDVSRPKAMTVRWIKYAQSKTKKNVKGMLTGPVTILNWSFVRDDKPRSEVSKQIALGLSDEIKDLQDEGIKIIQVDEAAFKEGYPLRKANIPKYEEWAVNNFKLAVSSAKKETQIHTHMCYSDFKSIIKTIELMDADVITIETARSDNVLLKTFRELGYKNEIGPGIYDIHSPRIPSVEEFMEQIRNRIKCFELEQIWINPDCGLKTRTWSEVLPALTNLVIAVKSFRK